MWSQVFAHNKDTLKRTAVCITLLGTEPRGIGKIPLFLYIRSSNVSTFKKKNLMSHFGPHFHSSHFQGSGHCCHLFSAH